MINKAKIKYFIFLITDRRGRWKNIEKDKKRINIVKFTIRLALDKNIKSHNPIKNSNEWCIKIYNFFTSSSSAIGK